MEWHLDGRDATEPPVVEVKQQLEMTRLHGRMKLLLLRLVGTLLHRARMFVDVVDAVESRRLFFFLILKTQSTTARFSFFLVVVIAPNRKEPTLSFPPVFIDSRIGHFFFGIGWIRRIFLADRLFLDR